MNPFDLLKMKYVRLATGTIHVKTSGTVKWGEYQFLRTKCGVQPKGNKIAMSLSPFDTAKFCKRCGLNSIDDVFDPRIFEFDSIGIPKYCSEDLKKD